MCSHFFFQVYFVFGKLRKITTWLFYNLGILLQLKVIYIIIIWLITIFPINSKDFCATYGTSDHDVEADSESFVESPELVAVLRLEILCKPVYQREDDLQPVLERQHVTEWVLHPESGGSYRKL